MNSCGDYFKRVDTNKCSIGEDKRDAIESSCEEFLRLLGGYFRELRQLIDVAAFIRPAELADRAGVLGAIALAPQMNGKEPSIRLERRLCL